MDSAGGENACGRGVGSKCSCLTKKKEDLVPKWMFRSGALTRCGPISTLEVVVCGTARSMEDETRNDRRNANQNPEWWGDFS